MLRKITLHFAGFTSSHSGANGPQPLIKKARTQVDRKHLVRRSGSKTEGDHESSGDDTAPSSTKLGSGASQGDVVCSGSKDQAISKTKSFLSTVHVGGIFRIENSKTDPYPYFYMVCKLCRDAKCGMWVKPGAGSTWTIKG